MKRKFILLPIATITTIASTITPLMTSCSNGWISWDYLNNGKYVHNEYQPLAPSREINPISSGYAKLAQDKNNFAYDYLLNANSGFTAANEVLVKAWNVGFKIDNFDLASKTLDFQLIYDYDIEYSGDEHKTLAHVTCKHVTLDIYAHEITSNLKLYYLGPSHWNHDSESESDFYDFLKSSDSRDWSIKGDIWLKRGPGPGLGDMNCDYSKANIQEIYEKAGQDDARWECIKTIYSLIDHKMYYLKNFS